MVGVRDFTEVVPNYDSEPLVDGMMRKGLALQIFTWSNAVFLLEIRVEYSFGIETAIVSNCHNGKVGNFWIFYQLLKLLYPVMIDKLIEVLTKASIQKLR